jgi:AcrR family transcriptional regulator
MASLDARAAHDASAGDEGGGGGGQARHVAPLYKRLPPGPHRLERDQVLRHQRLRMQGAMVEAVAAHGYEATSVKQLIGLAGVSRRSFYEQFANKQECFLATFDLLARRLVTHVAASCDVGCEQLEQRLRRPLEALARCVEDPKAATLVLEAPPRLGLIGIRRLCQASAACERMLGEAFDACAQADSLPPPVLRAIAGGSQAGITRQLARPVHARDHEALARELLRWVMLFATPSTMALASRASVRRPGAVRAARAADRAPLPAAPRPDVRARLLDSALRLAAIEDYGELTGPRIADEAGVPIDAFFAVFTGHEECFRAAVEHVGDGLLQLAGESGAADGDWPRWLRRTLALLLGRLAERPLHARALVELAFIGGEPCVAANLERVRALAAALTAEAPPPAPAAATVEMIAGGLLHALRGQVAIGRLRTLPLLVDQLAFFVMAPCVGSRRAVAALGEHTGRAPAGSADAVDAQS